MFVQKSLRATWQREISRGSPDPYWWDITAWCMHKSIQERRRRRCIHACDRQRLVQVVMRVDLDAASALRLCHRL